MEIVTNISKLPSNERKLRCSLGFRECTFSYDDKYITIESKGAPDSGSRKYDLWRLIPNPATEETLKPEAATQMRRGFAFLLAALVLFFSEFRWSMPLLLPVSIFVGVLEAFVGYYRLRPRTFTHFFGSDGPALVSIPVNVIEGNRKAFIHGLSEATVCPNHSLWNDCYLTI